MKPIIKWAGGKYKLSKTLEKFLPDRKINRYVEPFFGGGGFFFYINSELDIKEKVIIEKNEKLINLYNCVANDLEGFINKLDVLVKNFFKTENKKEFYYSIREKFNSSSVSLNQAVMFLFLNKTCFNGLYRENLSGKFNVPFGSYKKYSFYDLENIKEVSRILKDTKIICGNFNQTEIRNGDFFYLDPPYIPLDKTSNFTSYTKDGFGYNLNKQLISLLKDINDSNGLFMLSNSYNEETLDMYSDYNINYIEASRSINSKPDKRNKVKEIVVRNY